MMMAVCQLNLRHLSMNTNSLGANYEYIDQITELSNVIADYEGETETIWHLGEFGEYTLDALLVGAYWHFTEWHAGQWSSSYAALCAIGRVFNPGMTDGPEPDSSEYYVYTELDSLAHAQGPHVQLTELDRE